MQSAGCGLNQIFEMVEWRDHNSKLMHCCGLNQIFEMVE